MEIEEVIITYAQLKQGLQRYKDPFGVGGFCYVPGVNNMFITNPNVEDENEPLLILELGDGAILGREYFYPTKMIIKGQIVNSFASSSLLVAEQGRKYMLGASLVMYQINNKRDTVLLYGGMTEMAVDLYKKLKFTIFDIPTLWQIKNTRPILQNFRLKGGVLSVVSKIFNSLVKPYIWLSSVPSKMYLNRFDIKKLSQTPVWVEDIVKNDEHKYGEYHSKEWFDWVLHNSFAENRYHSQALYGIYNNGEPIGFFLLTECGTSIEERNIDNVVFGTIREWGINDESVLGEKDIFLLALRCFSKRTDIVTISTANAGVRKKMKKYGFLKHGKYNIAFRPLKMKLDEDSKDVNNWRIRPCYSDTAFY